MIYKNYFVAGKYTVVKGKVLCYFLLFNLTMNLIYLSTLIS